MSVGSGFNLGSCCLNDWRELGTGSRVEAGLKQGLGFRV